MELGDLKISLKLQRASYSFNPECHCYTSGTKREKMNYEKRKSDKVATKETQTREKQQQKVDKMCAAGDTTGTRFTGLSSTQHLQTSMKEHF